MELKKFSIKLSGEEHHVLLDIFEQYLMSYVDVEKNQLRVNPNIGNSPEFRFIQSYIKIFHGEYEYRSFFEKCAKKRKEHIEWLFGSENDGEPQFNLPSNYDEMKKFLYKYDMDWLGDK